MLVTAGVAGAAEHDILTTLGLDTVESLGIHIKTDRITKKEGAASIRVQVDRPLVIPLGEVTSVDFDNAKLVYRADVRTLGEKGFAYLEMRVEYPNGRSYLSRGPKTRISGETDWRTLRTAFSLKKGRTPIRARLNLVVAGHGTVWVGNARVSKE